MPAAEHRVFAARMSMLPATAAFVAGFCDRHDIARDDALRLTLIVEELFTNSVVHGYRGESDAPVELALAAGSGEVTVVYGDAAPPFDPLARPPVPAADLAAPLESRPVGGLGIHLVRQLVASARYAREDGRNRLWLSMRCGR
jgi:anti-sigma regulatory factor (Ser/Thr protein kinase)